MEERAYTTNVCWGYYFARDMKEFHWISNALYAFLKHGHLSGTGIYRKQFKALIYFAVMWNAETIIKNAQ